MEIERLNKWADLLLDMGKRNNLINFKTSKVDEAEIFISNLTDFFAYVEHNKDFEVYDPKSEIESNDFIEELDDVCDTQHSKLSKEQYRLLYEHKLKKGQILVYNSNNKPIQALKSLSKKGNTAIEETGVNILYLALGFVNWTEDEKSQIIMKAPILLIPISIENDSVLEPYRIKISDNEIIVNPTFSFKLQNDFGIKLPEFEADITAYFESIEELVSKMKWTISHDCKLGIFSFQKINMYQDLKSNADIIVNSKNIQAIMGERDLTTNNGDGNESNVSETDLMELHNVVDADSSQSEAIEMAKQGKSFVLQGPPGTGKSQTITNIIAECLHEGKTILFVSEKLAALNVVYEKLKKVKLEDFCLELHSHKVNKKQVIEELCCTLRQQRSMVSEKAQQELKIRKDNLNKLNDYVEELYKKRPVINKNLYQIYNIIASCRKAPDIEYVIPNLKSKNEEYIEKAIEKLEEYTKLIPSVGLDYHKNVWYGFNVPDISYHVVIQLKNDLQSMVKICQSLKNESENIHRRYGIIVDCLRMYEVYRRFFALIKDCQFISPVVFKCHNIHELIKNVELMKKLAEIVLSKKRILDEFYDADIYKIEGTIIYKKLTRLFPKIMSRIFSSEYKHIIKSLKLCHKKRGRKLKYEIVVEDVEALSIYQETLNEYNCLASDTISLIERGYQDVNTDFDKLLVELNTLAELEKYKLEYGWLANISEDDFIAQQTTFKEISDSIDTIFLTSNGAEARLITQFSEDCNLKEMSISSLEEKCENCYKNIGFVQDWWKFSKLREEMYSLEILNFLNHTIENNIAPESISSSFKKAFYIQWADTIFHESTVLFNLTRIPHDEAVKCFKEKDELNFEINKAKIRANVSAKRPNLDMVAQGSAISVLFKEYEKKRKQKSVRQLLAEIKDLVLTIKPCFLMSPLSVSTFLSSEMQFDVVIFDEASQIFPQDAIGAIYRGKQLIVVGDSKQMPPTNFFNTSVDVGDDNEEENISDFESILDFCSASFPQRRLRWHYRSRYEQLIAFSNKNFYGNDLISFPSSKVDTQGIGVDYYFVDGVYDRQSRTNRTEAERVVELVFENIEKYPEHSLGVVAFSTAQQVLIEKLITKRRQEDSSKEYFFKSSQLEPFFVKNLETVQGDERDRIIFSIAYARDLQGRLLQNFGPINREGGERRLNVAFTRAKHNIQLITSMHCHDIELSNTQSVGVRLLREYLDYAENGNIALERTIKVSQFDSFESEFEMEVCDFLRKYGYSIDTQVGVSSFRIDLALKSPNSSNYLLAIECDGATYHSSKTARDRDRLRQNILENMGWKFYRIWSTDWFRNKQVEKIRLLNTVQEIVKETPCIKQMSYTIETSFEEKTEDKGFEFPKYQKADVKSIQAKLGRSVLDVVHAILEIEAPMSEEWLLKRIVNLYDKEKVTKSVMEKFDSDMIFCSKYGIIRRNNFLYLKDKEIPILRVSEDRDVKYISLEELALGFKEILKRNGYAEKIGLFRLLLKYLGFNRVSENVSVILDSALDLIKDEIDIKDDVISLKKSKP